MSWWHFLTYLKYTVKLSCMFQTDCRNLYSLSNWCLHFTTQEWRKRIISVSSSVTNYLLGAKYLLQKAMAPHSRTLSWKIPWTEEPGRLQSLVAKSWTHWATSSLTSYFITREGKGNPLQCSCLENPTDRGAWRAVVHGVAENWTWPKWLSTHGARCWDTKLLLA